MGRVSLNKVNLQIVSQRMEEFIALYRASLGESMGEAGLVEGGSRKRGIGKDNGLAGDLVVSRADIEVLENMRLEMEEMLKAV